MKQHNRLCALFILFLTDEIDSLKMNTSLETFQNTLIRIVIYTKKVIIFTMTSQMRLKVNLRAYDFLTFTVLKQRYNDFVENVSKRRVVCLELIKV